MSKDAPNAATTKPQASDLDLEDDDEEEAEDEAQKAMSEILAPKEWDLSKPDDGSRPVAEDVAAMWKGIQSNTPVKLLRGAIRVKVPAHKPNGEFFWKEELRTHGAFVLFNSQTNAVRISIKDQKLPDNPELDCEAMEVHPLDLAADFTYVPEGRSKMARGQQGQMLVRFNSNRPSEDSDMVVLPGGRPATAVQRMQDSGEPVVGGVRMSRG
jgi:hypothetical protein